MIQIRLLRPYRSQRGFRLATASVLIAVGLFLGMRGVAFVSAQAAPAGNPAKEDGSPLIGSRVVVEFASGKTTGPCRVTAVRPGKAAGALGGLTLVDLETGKRTTCGAAAIKQVKSAQGEILLVFDEPAKSLVAPDAENLDEIRAAVEAQSKAVPPKRVKPEPGKSKEKRPEPKSAEEKAEEEMAEAESRRAQKEKERREIFEKTGIMPWAELTEEEQKQATEEQKKYLKKVADASKLPMQFQETKYFLFLSDIPPQQTAMYVPYLDQMYVKLCEAYGIPKDTNIWQGKGVVIAFLDKESFHGFEVAFFGESKDGAAGLAHVSSDGNVVISCCRGNNPAFFATVLVHETAHGFMFRYKSPAQLPIWLEEGAADWIAASVVKGDNSVPRRQLAAMQSMRMTGTMGGFFDVKQAVLDNVFYGMASNVVDFLLRKDPKRFRKMLDEIKLGTPWEKALKDAYGWTTADLVASYGQAIGMPYLRP